MSRIFQDQDLRQYLLGDLSPTQEEELESAFFQDPDLLSRVELVRDDLADDYAAERLAAPDREKFERRLLASDEGREELAITNALRVAAVHPVQQSRPSWRTDRRWLGMAAAVPLAIVGLLAWRLMSGPEGSDQPGGEGSRIQTQEQAANPSSPTPTPQPPPSSSGPPAQQAAPITLATVLILTADLERSGGAPPTALTSTGVTEVELVVPRNGLEAGTYRARVESVEGTAVWSGPLTVPRPDGPDPRPRARLPLAKLAPGDYFFIVPAASDAAGGPRYYFRVRTR